jgi:hypothetical protein
LGEGGLKVEGQPKSFRALGNGAAFPRASGSGKDDPADGFEPLEKVGELTMGLLVELDGLSLGDMNFEGAEGLEFFKLCAEGGVFPLNVCTKVGQCPDTGG